MGRIIRVICATICLTILVGFWPFWMYAEAQHINVKKAAMLESVPVEVVVMEEAVNPEEAVVIITSITGVGSGVMISEDGLVLTAGHMLRAGLPAIVAITTEEASPSVVTLFDL